eukprot:CAMPEP_0113485674 /NCGR_PEP_ID=MMETSP0014_2-20120614/24605_1 /TAXON_ID=2857 /ORGANISM="Nitzschia sp." /LENGTH=734 /DNA_ID=CAMNT_0000379327 /DNA_START=281 /DNA_END=2485 /DNA_ORIENTATION=- /assembly_acc=CAM_ASM_000159
MTEETKSTLTRLKPSEVQMEIKDPVDPKALEQAKAIMNELLESSSSISVPAEKLLPVAKRLGDVPEDATTSSLVVTKEQCKAAFDGLTEQERTSLVNLQSRIQRFAMMQRKSVVDMEMDIPGGKLGIQSRLVALQVATLLVDGTHYSKSIDDKFICIEINTPLATTSITLPLPPLPTISRSVVSSNSRSPQNQGFIIPSTLRFTTTTATTIPIIVSHWFFAFFLAAAAAALVFRTPPTLAFLPTSIQKSAFIHPLRFSSHQGSSTLIVSAAKTTKTTTTPPTMTEDTKSTLTRLKPSEVQMEIKDPVDPKALEQAKAIINELLESSSSICVPADKLLRVAKRLGDVPEDATTSSLVVTKEQCKAAFDGLTEQERTSLVNLHSRIQRFATMQRKSVVDMEMDIPGGKAGHTVSPCSAAGCYAPGGRYPLPSSVLMTAVTARAAGVSMVVLASPKPQPITLAAAHVSDVDFFLPVGGAQAVAALAYGVDGVTTANNGSDSSTTSTPPCDVICGPGNQWVTAAKSIVNGKCGIDMLAGPSEVLVICDESASANVVAADLIAQAEHDVVARAILLSTNEETIQQIDAEVAKQVDALPEPNRSTAKAALGQSFAVLCETMDQCVKISDDIAPEHLEIQTKDSQAVADSCQNYGGLFIGAHAAEVLGDYGAGPNHTLPTGGTGKYTGGLSVFCFLRIRTWMRIDEVESTDAQTMVDDSIVMARLEGLEGHARAAEARKTT